jgi:hypothetical protein
MFLESSDQTCTYMYMLKLIPGYLPTRQSLYTLYLVFPRAKTFKFLQNYQLSYSFPWSIFPLIFYMSYVRYYSTLKIHLRSLKMPFTALVIPTIKLFGALQYFWLAGSCRYILHAAV